MDSEVTPRKITLLMSLAEGHMPRRELLHKFDDKTSNPKSCERSTSINPVTTTNYESSSGILDLDCCEGLSSYMDNFSLSKSTFNPGEMTGRSTETENSAMKQITDGVSASSFLRPVASVRHSMAMVSSIEQLEQRMHQQSTDIANLMRHSVCSSQFTQVDLTAEECSLIAREAPLPVMPHELDMNLTKNMEISKADTTDLSLGGYFKKRCEPFKNILPANTSPMCDVSNVYNAPVVILEAETNAVHECPRETRLIKSSCDMTLDSVPVRQPRIPPLPKNPAVVLTPADCEDTNKFYSIPLKLRETNVVPPKNLNVTTTLNNPPTNMNSSTNIEKSKNTTTYKHVDSTTFSVPISKIPIASTVRNKTMNINQPSYLAAPQLQHLGVHTVEDSVQEESSLSMSAIIHNYLGNESDVRASVLLNHIKQVKDQKEKQKLPLKEIDLNIQQNRQTKILDYATYINPNVESTSSATKMASTVQMRKNDENILDTQTIISHSTPKDSIPVSATDVTKSDVQTGSSKSPSTCCTVQENKIYSTMQPGDNTLRMSKVSGGSNILKIPSPNIQYKELDKSVDWRELLGRKSPLSNEGLAKVPDKWVEISANAVNGFVGVTIKAPLKINSLSDSWLTACIVMDQLPTKQEEITIDLPRFPVLLSPGQSEILTFHITSIVEVKKTVLPFTIYLKDSSMDLEIQQKGNFEVDFKLPMIQTVTIEGVNKGIRFQPTQEGATVTKTFVLISDCPVDLQLDLSIIEGSSTFIIGNLQEIKRSDIKKSLMSKTECRADGPKPNQPKLTQRNKFCRLSKGNAIQATLAFTAPKLSDIKLAEKQATFNGSLAVQMIGSNILVNKIHLTAVVGVAELSLSNNKLHLDCEKTDIVLSNSGSVPGTWKVTVKDLKDSTQPKFNVSMDSVTIHPGSKVAITVMYTGPEDELTKGILLFKDVAAGNEIKLNLAGGKNRPVQFPIKTNHTELPWVRKGRKELSIKNVSNEKVIVKCKLFGDGFMMETTKGSGTDLLLTFGPNETWGMSIIFEPSSCIPCIGRLAISLKNDPETVKSVRLHACDTGATPCWAGLVTCGDTALVAATARSPLYLTLQNRSRSPAFVSAKVHFNLQYMSVAASSRLIGAQCVVRGRGAAQLALEVDWARVERVAREAGSAAAHTLATVSVLTGAEYTRRRIIRILNEESTGELKMENLSDHLSRLIGSFEGEDTKVDELLKDFQETKKSLDVLVSGVQELSAQIDLPRELSDDLTILIADDTVLDHITLCD